MMQFVRKCAVFLTIQGVILSLVLICHDAGGEANFLAATVDKHRRLEAQPAPRIILVGGSNVAFGFESDRLERMLGRPVINMGLAAGVGVEFMLAELQSSLRRDDIVVLSLEYDHFARGAKAGRYSAVGFDADLLRQVLVFRPEGLFDLSLIHCRKIILDRGLSILGEIGRRGLLVNVSAKPLANPEIQSTRRAFNTWGDVVAHRQEPPRADPKWVDQLPLVADDRGFPNHALLERINRFVKKNKTLGVRVAFSFSPKSIGTIQRDAARAERLALALRGIDGLTMLDTPQDHTYRADQFFDTANHLTAEGAALRTSKLALAIKRLMMTANWEH